MKSITSIILFLLILPIIISQETIEDLKEEHNKECTDPTHKHYSKLTLGYITPWKTTGYDYLQKYYNKFDIISPVWFELKPERNDNNQFNIKIDGANYVDSSFIKQIRKKKPEMLILPRFRCEGFSLNDYLEWLQPSNFSHFLKILLRRIKHNKLNGITIDCNQLWLIEEAYVSLVKVLPELHEALSKEKMKIVVTLFPSADSMQNVLNHKRFEFLAKYIDYFNIMTYDYMQYNKEVKANFIAPLSWINQSIKGYVDIDGKGDGNANINEELTRKILLGLPFHGYALNKKDGKQGAIVDGKMFGELLEGNKSKGGRKAEMFWDKNECEHQIDLNDEFSIVYPTSRFIKERLDLTFLLKLGGCAIWDIGNGNEGLMEEF